MFKVGDIVEITKEADEEGMLDFKDGNGYEVLDSILEVCKDGFTWRAIKLENESGVRDWYGVGHFKLKEDIKVEKKECLFKEGQVVWDLLNGRGVIEEIVNNELYPVKVKFDLKDMDGDEIIDYYMADGRYAKTQNIRSLYFSEPKIEAATEPLFEPTLKGGDVVIISGFKDRATGEDFKIGVVEEETDEFVYTTGNDPWDKYARDFYRLGEKINFK